MKTKIKLLIMVFAAALLLSFVFAPSSHAALQAVGPVDAFTGWPAWYQDTTGLSLAPCFDNNGFCSTTMLAGPGFDPALPFVFPTNWPEEGFYFDASANAGTMLYLAALEFAYGSATPLRGQEITFARNRFVDRTAPAGDYTITHPYGVDTVTVDAGSAANGRGLFFTNDIGLGGPPFTGVLTATNIGPFLRCAGGPGCVNGVVTAPDGNVYIGNSVTAVPVSGGLGGVNSVTIVGPAPYPGGTGNTFILEGKVVGMSITPTTIAFPAQRPKESGGVSSPVTVTVINLSSSSTLTIAAAPNGVVVGGANAADFQIITDTCSGTPVPASTPTAPGTCTFNVVFSGAAAGPVARTAIVTVSAQLGTVPKVAVAPITGIIDAVAPTVLSSFPTTPTAPANINITATFSESMLASSITNTTFLLFSNGVPVTGTAPVYSDANKTASIALPVAQEAALKGTAITAQITTGMTDLVGNTLASAVTFTFTATDADRVPPTIALFDPPNNATGVETNVPLKVTFSEAMLSTSITGSVLTVTAGGVPVDGTVTVDGAVATFTPTRPLAFGTAFTVTITTGALDFASNALAASKAINFVTNFAPIAPEVLFPANGATGVTRPVVLRWRPSVDQDQDAIQYHLFLCSNQNFIGTAPNCIQDVKITPATARAKGVYYASVAGGGMLFSLFGLGWAFGFKGRKRILMLIAVLVISMLFVVSCSKSDNGGPAPSTDLAFQVDGLASNVTFFWKMEADDGKGGVTATPVMSFTTQ